MLPSIVISHGHGLAGPPPKANVILTTRIYVHVPLDYMKHCEHARVWFGVQMLLRTRSCALTEHLDMCSPQLHHTRVNVPRFLLLARSQLRSALDTANVPTSE